MGIKDWFGRQKQQQQREAPPAVDLAAVDPEGVARARELAGERLRPGFASRDSVVDVVADMLADEYEVADRAVAETVVDQVRAERQAEIAAGSGPDDSARLEAAFATLHERGVLALMDFTCCQTCGHAEIADHRTPSRGEPSYLGWGSHREGNLDAPGWQEWGYAFFHQQDTERLVESPAVLYLGFGSFSPAPGTDPDQVRAAVDDEQAWAELHAQSDLAAGQVVVDTLREHGFPVHWDGNVGARPQVSIRDWRRPLPA